MKSRLIYYLVYSGMWLLASLPLNCLYVLSDGLYYILYYIIGYRRKVVRENLIKSFPEKETSEIVHIEKKFYHYICDYFLEEVKLLKMPPEELLRRMTYINKSEYLQKVEDYGGIVLLIPHYANFEWITGMGMIMNPDHVPVQVYKPLSNPYLDKLFLKLRSRFGGYNVAKHSTGRELLKLRRDKKKMAIGLITDQSPSAVDSRHWTTFLNQETAFMSGAERIAKMLKFPVFYCELKRLKRGYCEVSFELLTDFPQDLSDGEVTELFAKKVESTIIREPAYWFWSHKRWKLKKEDESKK